MGRLSAGYKSALQASVINLGLFAEFEFDSGTERFWTGESSITWNFQIWQGGGLIGGVSMEGEGDSLAARRVVFTLNNVDRAYYAIAVSTEYRNRPVRIWLNILDSTGANVVQSHLMEEGRMDTMEIGRDGTLQLTVESRLLDLFRPNVYRMTSADHKRLYPTDDFYMYVPSLPTTELPWGLEPRNTGSGIDPGGARPGWGGRIQ